MKRSNRGSALTSGLTVLGIAVFLIIAGVYSTQRLQDRRDQNSERDLRSKLGVSNNRNVGRIAEIKIPLPDFEVQCADGEIVSKKSMKGRIWVANFIFTNCAGICIEMSQMTQKLQNMIKDLEDVHFVSFTVDPERDTPEVLKSYAQEYEANPSRWHFVTTDKESMTKIGVEGFKQGDSEDMLNHSNKLCLVDIDGNMRGFYDGAGKYRVGEVDQLEKDIRTLKARGGR